MTHQLLGLTLLSLPLPWGTVQTDALVVQDPPVKAPDHGARIRLDHQPKAGDVIEVTLQQSSATVIDYETWTEITDGERGEPASTEVEGQGKWSFDVELKHVDVYDQVRDGWTVKLRRSFPSMKGSNRTTEFAEGGDRLTSTALESPLVGRTIEFDWEPAKNDYVRSFSMKGPDPDVDAVLEADARIDAFGDWFLPVGGRAEVGDTWDAGSGAWHDMLGAGGDFWVDTVDAEEPSLEAARRKRAFESQLRTKSKGTVKCELKRVTSAEGVRLAEIRVRVKLRSRAVIDATEIGDSAALDAEEVTVQGIDATGTCLWDIDSGCAKSIVFDARVVESATTQTGDRRRAIEWVTVMETETKIEMLFRNAR